MPHKDPEKAKNYRQEYYKKNREKKLAYNKEWAKNNKEKITVHKKKYLLNNPDKRKESWSDYNSSKEGREKKHKWYRKWANDIGIKEWNEWIEERQKNAKYENYPKEFTCKLKNLIKKRDDYICQTCRMPEPLSQIIYNRTLTIHHKDYNRNNNDEHNLVTLCLGCNVRANKLREYWKVVYGIKNPKTIIVIPTIRESAIKTFLSVWQKELEKCTILVIEDNPTKTFEINNYPNVLHFCHKDIDSDLDKNAWIIPRKTSAICSYGFYKAYKLGADVTIKMDDDLLIKKQGFLESHIHNIFKPRPLYWANVFKDAYPRGFPYCERNYPTVLNYGLADNILDLDAPTQILQQTAHLSSPISLTSGCYAPICGMNISFLTQITPAFYYTLQGPSWGIDRYDDIIAGVFIKKITDHLKNVISIGEPIVTHNKLSDPLQNLYKEAGGMDINEILWQEVDKIKFRTSSYKDCYIELAKKIKIPVYEYGKSLKKAMIIWANLF